MVVRGRVVYRGTERMSAELGGFVQLGGQVGRDWSPLRQVFIIVCSGLAYFCACGDSLVFGALMRMDARWMCRH